jgi:small nuclear ribonucleoprotein G
VDKFLNPDPDIQGDYAVSCWVQQNSVVDILNVVGDEGTKAKNVSWGEECGGHGKGGEAREGGRRGKEGVAGEKAVVFGFNTQRIHRICQEESWGNGATGPEFTGPHTQTLFFPSRCTMASSGPDLKKYMGKMVGLKLNNNRQVRGMLAGYDQFMNLVLDDAVQIISSSEQHKLGQLVVRGNSVIRLEHLGKKWAQEEAAKQ